MGQVVPRRRDGPRRYALPGEPPPSDRAHLRLAQADIAREGDLHHAAALFRRLDEQPHLAAWLSGQYRRGLTLAGPAHVRHLHDYAAQATRYPHLLADLNPGVGPADLRRLLGEHHRALRQGLLGEPGARPALAEIARALLVPPHRVYPGGVTLTLTGTVGGTGPLQKGIPAAAAVGNAPASNSAGTLVLTNANTYTGATTVNQGTLALAGNGTALGSSGFTVNAGAPLLLDNTSGTTGTAVNNLNRLGDAATLTLNGGNFVYQGANGAASSETIGNLPVGAGQATIKTTAGTSGSVNLALGITLTADATLGNNGIIPRATVTDGNAGGSGVGFNLATDSASGSLFSIGAYTAYTTLTTGATTATTNYILNGGSVTLGQADTVNSLLLVGGATVTGAQNLTVGTGLIVSAGGSNTISVTGATGIMQTVEAKIITNTGSTLSVPAIITGSGVVATFGGGTLNLSGASTFTGGSFLDSAPSSSVSPVPGPSPTARSGPGA
jgi:autotransporter-associated beta strand protein